MYAQTYGRTHRLDMLSMLFSIKPLTYVASLDLLRHRKLRRHQPYGKIHSSKFESRKSKRRLTSLDLWLLLALTKILKMKLVLLEYTLYLIRIIADLEKQSDLSETIFSISSNMMETKEAGF